MNRLTIPSQLAEFDVMLGQWFFRALALVIAPSLVLIRERRLQARQLNLAEHFRTFQGCKR